MKPCLMHALVGAFLRRLHTAEAVSTKTLYPPLDAIFREPVPFFEHTELTLGGGGKPAVGILRGAPE